MNTKKLIITTALILSLGSGSIIGAIYGGKAINKNIAYNMALSETVKFDEFYGPAEFAYIVTVEDLGLAFRYENGELSKDAIKIKSVMDLSKMFEGMVMVDLTQYREINMASYDLAPQDIQGLVQNSWDEYDATTNTLVPVKTLTADGFYFDRIDDIGSSMVGFYKVPL